MERVSDDNCTLSWFLLSQQSFFAQANQIVSQMTPYISAYACGFALCPQHVQFLQYQETEYAIITSTIVTSAIVTRHALLLAEGTWGLGTMLLQTRHHKAKIPSF